MNMICPACGTATSRSNLSRHRSKPVHQAAIARLGADPSVVADGPTAATPEQFAERFWSRVDQSSGPAGCWPWIGARQLEGYGKLAWNGQMLVASRVALELATGRVLAPDEDARHSCDNPPCCNPAHLSPGSRLENMRDAASRGRIPRGSERASSKLTEADVQRIRALRATTEIAVLAVRFGVAEATIRDIVEGRKWRHVA